MSRRTPKVRVVVDAMGADKGPSVVVDGAVLAHRELGLAVTLVGPRDAVDPELARYPGVDLPLIDAPDIVAMGERVSRSTLKKRSSIHVAMEMLRDGAADAFFSGGNTAACWTIAKMSLGTLSGVDRPALAAMVPNIKGRTLLLDVGANANCKARHLEEFAVMGSLYVRAVLGIAHPRVGLMSMGEESTKGNELTKEVHEVLKASALNFVGNVEGHDVYNGKVDVIVMDGFTGNVALKVSESLAESLFHLIKEEMTRDPVRKFGAWMAQGAFMDIKRRTDASEYGGAPLLGVAGCVVIGHGRSNARAIRQGIKAAAEFARSGVNGQIETELRALARQETRPA